MLTSRLCQKDRYLLYLWLFINLQEAPVYHDRNRSDYRIISELSQVCLEVGACIDALAVSGAGGSQVAVHILAVPAVGPATAAHVRRSHRLAVWLTMR